MKTASLRRYFLPRLARFWSHITLKTDLLVQIHSSDSATGDCFEKGPKSGREWDPFFACFSFSSSISGEISSYYKWYKSWINSRCGPIQWYLFFIIPAFKSSSTGAAVTVPKRRPVSAHLSQPKPWSKPPPAFDTSKTKRQLELIEKDLKRTTKALQDRLGISKQGFV